MTCTKTHKGRDQAILAMVYDRDNDILYSAKNGHPNRMTGRQPGTLTAAKSIHNQNDHPHQYEYSGNYNLKIQEGEEQVLIGHIDSIYCLVYDEETLYSAGADLSIRIWHRNKMEAEGSSSMMTRKRVLERGHEQWITSLALDNKTGTLFSAGGDTVIVWRGLSS